jgi:TPR repeat protein
MSRKPNLACLLACLLIAPAAYAQQAEQATADAVAKATAPVSAEQIVQWRKTGIAYYTGEDRFIRQNYKTAREYLERAAQKDDAIALHYLATLYNDGKGVAKDEDKARELFSKAAELGHADSQVLSAVFIITDGILARDEETRARHYQSAVDLLRKAYAQGNMEAAFWLGDMMHKGLGTEKNKAEGRKLIRESAQSGNPNAEAMLGMFYFLGQGGEKKNPSKAHLWLSRAARHGNDQASILLLRIEGQMSDAEKAAAREKARQEELAEEKSGAASKRTNLFGNGRR